MKVNELMIGDWVSLWNKPQRVNYINLDDGERIGTDKQYLAQIVEAFEPIPLTAEILEKNEFIRQQFGHFRYENEDNDLVMAFYPKKKSYTEGGYDYIDIYKGRMTLREMPISYVHELQHILKDCRIDKEIVL